MDPRDSGVNAARSAKRSLLEDLLPRETQVEFVRTLDAEDLRTT